MYEWDVFYQNEWVGQVYEDTFKEALEFARYEFENEPWDAKDITVHKSKDQP